MSNLIWPFFLNTLIIRKKTRTTGMDEIRKIAIKKALELLDTMEFEDPMKKQIELFGNSEQLKGR